MRATFIISSNAPAAGLPRCVSDKLRKQRAHHAADEDEEAAVRQVGAGCRGGMACNNQSEEEPGHGLCFLSSAEMA